MAATAATAASASADAKWTPAKVDAMIAGAEKMYPKLSFREDDDKGRHVVATEDIPRGTLVLMDAPFHFSLDARVRGRVPEDVVPVDGEDGAEAFQKRGWTGADLKERFAHSIGAEDRTTASRVMDTNGFVCHNFLDQTRWAEGLYVFGSRFNHSCAPNAKEVFGLRGCMFVATIKDVKKGEEVTIAYKSYMHLECTCSRQKRLELILGGPCRCTRCASNPCPEGHTPWDPWKDAGALGYEGLCAMVEKMRDSDEVDNDQLDMDAADYFFWFGISLYNQMRAADFAFDASRLVDDLRGMALYCNEHNALGASYLRLLALSLTKTKLSVTDADEVVRALRAKYPWSKNPGQFVVTPALFRPTFWRKRALIK